MIFVSFYVVTKGDEEMIVGRLRSFLVSLNVLMQFSRLNYQGIYVDRIKSLQYFSLFFNSIIPL